MLSAAHDPLSCQAMSDATPIRGELQQEVMRILWGRDGARVEEVRSALPASRDVAYTTVQTVLNRLVDRGLVERRKQGKAFTYQARLSEADYLSESLDGLLAVASAGARGGALAYLAETISDDDVQAFRRGSRRRKR